jgi:hypothetical protein
MMSALFDAEKLEGNTLVDRLIEWKMQGHASARISTVNR